MRRLGRYWCEYFRFLAKTPGYLRKLWFRRRLSPRQFFRLFGELGDLDCTRMQEKLLKKYSCYVKKMEESLENVLLPGETLNRTDHFVADHDGVSQNSGKTSSV